MSLTTRVLVALVAGIGVGVGLSFTENPSLAQWIEPLGALFINAIRMTIIPLVVSSLIVGVTSAPDARTIGRLGGRALVFMLVSLIIACALGVMAAGPAFSLLSIDPAASAALRASASVDPAQSAQAMPSFMQWLVALVPANPIKAAADGAMLPLIIFSLSFGVALTHIDAARRVAVVRVFEGILDASLVVVHSILRLAPIGVFALAVPLAAKLGLSAAGALITYIGVVSLLSSLLIALLYPVAVLGGRVKLGVFARAILPAQAMAFSGRSSLASLPAMITASRDTLGLPPQIAGFLIPLLTATYRIGAGVGQTVPIVFISHLYGIPLGPTQLATIALTAVVVSFSVPGIPGGTIIAMVPVLMAAGLPIEGAGIMLGVDTIPDMFRTTANVTGDMTAAVVLGAREKDERVDEGVSEG
ncbi:MAG: dicarboxylate/amino acid:cation symporter [Gemmatimonadaceae bacterium]|jgi:Na+/H+-dicarboxylate symporter|nr:dicarboxylate/amino acid:cation symporter [Gemmatimonadaceae bacterium]